MNNVEEKVELIKLLAQLNGQTIINKLEGKDNSELVKKERKVAEKLAEEGIGNFDFSSDEKFEESLNKFLTEF